MASSKQPVGWNGVSARLACDAYNDMARIEVHVKCRCSVGHDSPAAGAVGIDEIRDNLAVGLVIDDEALVASADSCGDRGQGECHCEIVAVAAVHPSDRPATDKNRLGGTSRLFEPGQAEFGGKSGAGVAQDREVDVAA